MAANFQRKLDREHMAAASAAGDASQCHVRSRPPAPVTPAQTEPPPAAVGQTRTANRGHAVPGRSAGALPRPCVPRPASSNGSCSSGRTTSASRPPRAACARHRRGLRARGDPAASCSAASPTCCCAVEQPPGHAGLSRQSAVVRPEFARRPEPQARPQRELGARDPRAAHARRRRRLHARPTSPRSPASSPAGRSPAARDGSASPGSFTFFANAHEPGEQTLLGKTYTAGGIEQGEAALADLARHPATARHIAPKLARHFIADKPPPALVERLAKVFATADGDLKALALTARRHDEAWAPRSREDALAARIPDRRRPRAVGRVPEDPGQLLGRLNVDGQAAVAAARAERLSRHGRRLGLARRA